MIRPITAPANLEIVAPAAGVWPWRFDLDDMVRVQTTNPSAADFPHSADEVLIIAAAAQHQESGWPHYLVEDGNGGRWWIPQSRMLPADSRNLAVLRRG